MKFPASHIFKQYFKRLYFLHQENSAFLSRMGIGDSPQVLINGVPMKADEMEAENFEESVVSQILRLTPGLQKDVYHVSSPILDTLLKIMNEFWAE